MAGEINFGLLNQNAPAEAALAPVKGMGAVNALISQDLQNQSDQFAMQNALAEQQAYKQAGGDIAAAQKNLMSAGLGKQSVALGQAQAKTNLDQIKALSERLPIQMEMSKNMALNPSPQNIMTNLDYQVKMGWMTPQQAQNTLQGLQGKTPQELSAYFTNMALKAEDFGKHLETVRHNTRTEDISQQNANIAGGHLGLARERLSQEMAGGTLTPETVDMAANMFLKTGQLPQLGMGKQAAAARQAILNRATVLGTTGADGQPAPTTADVASNVITAKQDIAGQTKSYKDFTTGMQGRQVNSFNTAIDHLATMDKLSDALANGDTKAINAIGNMVAKQTGSAAPTSFNAAKQIVTAEVIKSIVASGGGVKERQEAEANFAAANSPAQLKGVINTYKDLMGGQLKSLELQYGNTTGRKDFEKKLTPAAKETLGKLKSETTGIPQGAIDALKSGKGTREQFDQIFGAGASDKVLGKGK